MVYDAWLEKCTEKSICSLYMYIIILRNGSNLLKKYFSYFIDTDTQIKSILYENIAQSQEF